MIFSQCLLIFYWWYKFIDDKTDAYRLGGLSWNEGFGNRHTSFRIQYFQCPFLSHEAFLLFLTLSDLSFLKRFSCWHEEVSSHIVKDMVRRVCRTCRKPSVLTAAQWEPARMRGPWFPTKASCWVLSPTTRAWKRTLSSTKEWRPAKFLIASLEMLNKRLS